MRGGKTYITLKFLTLPISFQVYVVYTIFLSTTSLIKYQEIEPKDMEKHKDGTSIADRERGLELATGEIPFHVSVNKMSLKNINSYQISGVTSKQPLHDCYTTCQGKKSNMAASAMKELRVCTSLIRQCCSNWKSFPQSNVKNSAAVVSGINKCVHMALVLKFIK